MTTELHNAKKLAHKYFDLLWKSNQMSRTAAYTWLADAMEMTAGSCHISNMNTEQCVLVAELSIEKRN